MEEDQSKCTIFDGEGDEDGVVASARLHTTGKFLNDENYVCLRAGALSAGAAWENSVGRM